MFQSIIYWIATDFTNKEISRFICSNAFSNICYIISGLALQFFSVLNGKIISKFKKERGNVSLKKFFKTFCFYTRTMSNIVSKAKKFRYIEFYLI